MKTCSSPTYASLNTRVYLSHQINIYGPCISKSCVVYIYIFSGASNIPPPLCTSYLWYRVTRRRSGYSAWQDKTVYLSSHIRLSGDIIFGKVHHRIMYTYMYIYIFFGNIMLCSTWIPYYMVIIPVFIEVILSILDCVNLLPSHYLVLNEWIYSDSNDYDKCIVLNEWIYTNPNDSLKSDHLEHFSLYQISW